MKKYLYLLILVLMLGACNIPINPTPTADLVSTAVSGTLTSAPTNTIAVPTETQPPVPTQAITSTPRETPTLTPIFTNTPNAEDPAIRLGEPTKVEEFDTPSGTWTYEDD